MRLPGPITALLYGVALGLYAAALVVITLANSRDFHIGALLAFIGAIITVIAAATNAWEQGRRRKD